MIRRGLWLAAGVAAGAGGTIWSRRRLQGLAERARAGQIPSDITRLVERGGRRISRRVGTAVDAGRVQARRRESELRLALRPGPRAH